MIIIIIIITIIKGDGSECPVAEQTGQLQVTYRPTFCVAHGKLKDEKQAGVVKKKKKNPLKFTNGGENAETRGQGGRRRTQHLA